MSKNISVKNNLLSNNCIYLINKNKFLFLLCIACSFVVVTPFGSLAQQINPDAVENITKTFLSPILLQEKFNIAQVTQSLAALTLVSAFLERAMEIWFRLRPNPNPENKRKNIQVSSFFAGLFISLVGVRGLEPLFVTPTDIVQLTLFRLIDILLTGIIISEGTAGVHNILTSLTAFLDTSKHEPTQKENADTGGTVGTSTSGNGP
jgi:hypothetical protein